MPCYQEDVPKEFWLKLNKKLLPLLKEANIDVDFKADLNSCELLNQNTDKLCSFCKSTSLKNYSDELKIWWEEHQMQDRNQLLQKLAKIKQLHINSALEKYEIDKKEFILNLPPYEQNLIKSEL